jgi:hypothetical protein
MPQQPVSGSGADGSDTQRHPRVTIGDEAGKVYFEDLFRSVGPYGQIPVIASTAGSRTAFGTFTTTYQQLLLIQQSCSLLQVMNTLTMGTGGYLVLGLQVGGSGAIIDKWFVETDSFTLPLRSCSILLPASSVIYGRYVTAAPTAGSLRITAL